MVWFLFNKKQRALAEIIVRAIEISEDATDKEIEKSSVDNVQSNIPAKFIITISIPAAVSELRDKIYGKYKPLYYCTFVYDGRVLELDETIPIEAYESFSPVDDDSDFFKPRITMCLDKNRPIPVEIVIEDVVREEKVEVEAVDTSAIDQENTRANLVAHYRTIDEKRTANNFDLMKELEAIGCEEFYHKLLTAGYNQEGAFAYMTEEALISVDRLKLPKKAIKRLLAAAETMKKRIEEQENITANKFAHLKSHQRRTKIIKTNDNQDFETNKRELSEELLKKINKIYKSFERDEEEIYQTAEEKNRYCCEKHGNVVMKRRTELHAHNLEHFRMELLAKMDWIACCDGAFSAIDRMIGLTIQTIEAHGWRNAVTEQQLRDVLLTSGRLSAKELAEVERWLLLESPFPGNKSVFALDKFTKAKCLEVIVAFIDESLPEFFNNYVT